MDPALVDFAALARWMDDQGLPPGDFTEVTELTGGTQNVMLYVLRRPPRHLRKRSNDALIRERRPGRHHLVPRPGLLQARHRPGRNPRPRLRGRGTQARSLT
ncbi:hypothetical protein ACWEV3_14130 [Saccharopolyspora sp. NPDC003752]